jgi:hypothetical protein
LRRHRLVLAALLACYLALASVYNTLIPLGEGPDEAGHMAYVLFLVRNARLPDQLKGTAGEVPGEGHQPPLAYLLMTPAAEWLPGKTRRVVLTPNPDFVWNGGTSPAAFSRGSQELWPWQGVPLAWHLARAVSTLLGVVTISGTWGLARALRPDWPALALASAALLAFNPQFLFASGLVSNDPLLFALSALLLWACAHALRGGAFVLRLSPAVVLGGLLSLALVTKQSALLLVPLAVLTLLLPPLSRDWRARLRKLLILAVLCALLAGWWYARNWWMYGDPLGFKVFKAEFRSEPFAWNSAAAWVASLDRLHRSFWGYFGWLTIPWPAWIYGLIGVAELVALAGLARFVWRPYAGLQRRQEILSQIAKPAPADALMPIAYCVLPITLAAAWTLSFALTAGQVAWQGRFLFPALPAIALLMAWGLLSGGVRLARAGIAGLALLAVLSPWGSIRPAYEWFVVSEQAARAQIQAGTPVYARFADYDRLGIELHSWRLETQPLRIGQSAVLTLTWHARTRIAADWIVFVHLVDGEELLFASDRPPLDGRFPSSQWTQGDWLIDPQELVLPPDLAPGRYIVRIGLFDKATGRRAPFFNDDDTRDVEGNSFDLGFVELSE